MADPLSARLGAGSRRQLIQVGGGALVLAAILFSIAYLVLSRPMEPAFTGLKPSDAALIVDALKKQKQTYALADDGATIMVPRDDVSAARLSILGGDLPLKGTVGFELFNKSDIGLTEFAQKVNYQRALQGELSRTLGAMSNIESARVHIALPDSGIFAETRRSAKASVTVVPKLGAMIDSRTVSGIQRLVASAVAELAPADVVVLDGAGRQMSDEALPIYAEPAPADADSAIEQSYAMQVRTAALQVVDDPRLRVAVSIVGGAANQPEAMSSVASTDDGARPTGGMAGRVFTAKSGVRRFALRLVVSLSAEPPPGLRERIAALLANAIGYDEQQGDSLVLIQMPGPATPSPGVTAEPDPEPKPVWPFGLTGWPLGILLGVPLLVLAAALGLRLTRQGRLSESERESFVERLQDLLAQDERQRGDQA